jgi:hypothetical protein
MHCKMAQLMPQLVLSLAILCHVHFVGTAFFLPQGQWQAQACGKSIQDIEPASTKWSIPGLQLSSSDSIDYSSNREGGQNRIYIEGLMSNLGTLCDKYIMNGSPKIRERVFNVLDQIAAQAIDEDMIRQSIRMVKRAGVPMHKTYLERFQKDEDGHRKETTGGRKTQRMGARTLSKQSTTTKFLDGYNKARKNVIIVSRHVGIVTTYCYTT